MKKYILFIISLSSTSLFSQTVILDATNPALVNTKRFTYTIDFSVSNLETVSLMKNELISWDTKIISVTINEADKKMVFTHTNQFNQLEFIELLGKYNMSKKQIVSYQ